MRVIYRTGNAIHSAAPGVCLVPAFIPLVLFYNLCSQRCFIRITPSDFSSLRSSCA